MAKTPRKLGQGEGGSRVPSLEKLLNDIAEDLKAIYEDSDDIYDADRKHRASKNDDKPTAPEVEITEDNLETAFTDESAPNTYDTDVTVKVKENVGIETDGLTVTLLVVDSDETEVLTVEQTPADIREEESAEITLAVNEEITDADTYSAAVIVSGENFETVSITHEFVVSEQEVR